MIIVLRKHGKPLHFTEIAERVNQRLPQDKQTGVHNMHNQLGRLPNIFVRVGRGLFGLAEWGLVQEDHSADTAYRILRETGHPLELEELIDRTLEIWHVQRNSVRAGVDLDPRFQKVGRNLYWVKDAHQTEGEEQRTDDFDTLFGKHLVERQQELQRLDSDQDLGVELDEARRLGSELFN